MKPLTINEVDARIDEFIKYEQTTRHSFNIRFVHAYLPASETEEFDKLTRENTPLFIPEVSVVLIRDDDSEFEDDDMCQNCVWGNQVCESLGHHHSDGRAREMPCEWRHAENRPFKAFDLHQFLNAGKNNEVKNKKSGYTPDRPEDFDIKGTWNSIRTMIGM